MQNIGNCVLCGRMFGVRPHERLQGGAELSAFEEQGNVVLPVSLRVALLVIGGQLSGFSDPTVRSLIVDGSGLNVREFFGSRVCPLCFPSDDAADDDVDTDEDEDEYEGDDSDYDPEAVDDRPVNVLKITADGSVRELTVCGLNDMKIQTGLVKDNDNCYLKDLGVYFWFDANAQREKLKLNVFCSILYGSPVRGDVVIIGDITKNLFRSSEWQDLPRDWFDLRLAEVISIANTDQEVLSNISEFFQ